jgi:hypothetical protein
VDMVRRTMDFPEGTPGGPNARCPARPTMPSQTGCPPRTHFGLSEMPWLDRQLWDRRGREIEAARKLL